MNLREKQPRISDTAIIIPAYNCEKPLAPLLLAIGKMAPGIPVMVIDDGSMDNTRFVPEEFGAHCMRHAQRMGKGEALRAGFAWARGKEFEYAVTMDADGQHSPDDLQAILQAKGDLVLGARSFEPGVMPITRIFSNSLSSFILSGITRRLVRDSQCGFRKIRLDAIRDLRGGITGYQFETEMILHIALKQKGTIVNIPVRTIYEGQKSHIRHVPDMWEFVRAAARYWKLR